MGNCFLFEFEFKHEEQALFTAENIWIQIIIIIINSFYIAQNYNKVSKRFREGEKRKTSNEVYNEQEWNKTGTFLQQKL